jgi:hypothetical protein
MKYSKSQHKNLAGETKAEIHPPRHRRGGTVRPPKPNKLARRPIRLALFLSLACVGLFFTLYPFGVEGKKGNVQQDGDGQFQSTRAEAIGSAVVNFQELARQQALNPQTSEPMPSAITAPKTIDDSVYDTLRPLAPAANVPVDLPGPNIPSPGPANNFAALDDIPFAPPGTAFFTIPPDTMGAVGSDSVNKVLVTLNNNFRVLNKTTGAQIGSDVSMRNFWAAAGATSAFDPRVQYDRYNDRWILAAVTEAGTATTSIMVGISLTSDPSGSYALFKFPARIATDAANINFADFPMLGFNKNWVVVSINMFTSAGAFSNERVLVLDYPTFRTGVFAGNYFTGGTDFCLHPATTYSATEPTEYLVNHLSSAGATYRLSTITGTPAAPVITIGAVMVRPGGGWTQPGGNILPQAMGTCTTTPMKMDVGDAQVRTNVVFRNNTIWYPQTVGIPAGGLTHTASQWTQLNTAGAVLQGGRVEDPTATATNGGKWYAYASIAVNASNDVLFGFSQFSSAQFASAGYTYRDHTDALGTMRDPFIFKAGEDCYSKDFGSGRNRWGDYSHTMVDPTDDCSFWTIQEYAKLQAPPTVGGSDSKWGTWWARVNALVPCATAVAAGSTLVNESCPPANGAIDPGETPTVNLRLMNSGTGPTSNLVATLQPNANVLAPSGPQTYGAMAPGTTAGRDFTFTAAGNCGDVITLTLQLQDGATSLGTASYTFTLGCNTACAGAPRISVSSALSCSGSNTVATINICNSGTATANSVVLTTAALGGVSGTPLPQSVGTLAPGACDSRTVTFTGAPSGATTLQVGGTYTGGSFNSSRKVTAPVCGP